ncbi:MAG: 2Fe-2S iron-sulfur cluster-binding protein [Verrucomicrobiota bacterium]|nr:2Fe-2S iron-sulfur cluster-binding protein [Verrucomicrobiota bacterium]
MSDPAKPDNLISVFVDGEEVRVRPGTNMIEAATLAGKEIPHYCYHSKLSVVGNCRMCLVEMGMPAVDPTTRQPVMDAASGKQKVNWMPRPTIACATNATPGLQIKTSSPMVKECREGVMEFLLVNHPLDCPICDQAGECRLQEFATDYGRGYSRFVEEKNVKPKRTKLGPRVMLDDERCILCSRCIRFCQEIAKDDVLGFISRGSYSTLTCFPGKELANNYSLNTVDICPVGALTSSDFRFKMRVWFLKETNSICTESSVGVNTIVSSREGTIYRITPRRNDDVNDTWMSDSGRDLFKQVAAENRLDKYALDGAPVTADQAVAEAATLLKAGKVAIVGSGRSSVEEQFLLKKLAQAVGNPPVYLVSRVQPGDGLLVSADRNPNVRGALVTGLINELPEQQLAKLAAAIESGAVKTILSVDEDLTLAGLTTDQLKKVQVIYLGTHHNSTSQIAKVELPVLTVFERTGTFINQQFRVQKFHQAVPGPAGVLNTLSVLGKLLALNGQNVTATPQGVWPLLAAEVPALAGMAFDTLPDTGKLINASTWEHLPYCEGKTLKYEPKKPAATAQ